MRRSKDKIAFFLPHLGPGGAQRVFVDVTKGLAQRGYDIDMVLAYKKGPRVDDLDEKVRLVNLGARKITTSLPALVRYLRKEEPAILLSTVEITNIIAALAARLSGKPVKNIIRVSNTISMLTNDSDHLNTYLTRYTVPFLYPMADHIVCVSEGVKKDLESLIWKETKEISVIYNPVITEELLTKKERPVDHPWFDDERTRPVILAVGRLWIQKDYPNLVKALKKLHETVEARLVILGEGPERTMLEQFIADMGLNGFVDLPGYVSNPFAYMKRADLYVLSSRWEGLPGSLIQAVACGCTAVATDCPSGPSEILSDGKYGYLAEPENSDELAECMLKGLRNKTDPPDTAWFERFEEKTAIDKYESLISGLL